MKIKALFLGLFFLLPIFSWTQPYEITEVDIFSLKKPISAKDITVYGISIENSLQEVLDKFGKNISDLSSSEPEKYYFLKIAPGVSIRSTDKKTIDAIFLGPDFKDNLKGKAHRPSPCRENPHLAPHRIQRPQPGQSSNQGGRQRESANT